MASSKRVNKKARQQRQKDRNKVKLQQGRPPLAPKPRATLSSKATNNVIRTHHELNRQIVRARKEHNQDKVVALLDERNKSGGLESYQKASIQGQASDRGGDSSKILIDWLTDVKPAIRGLESKLRLLEVGALSTQNACSKSGLFEVTRIDLNTQAEGITKQDFMERPLPKNDKDKFDVISLSLVLNFGGAPEDRGKMLMRTCQFLSKHKADPLPTELRDYFPSLFLVLPASCIVNSKYMSEERLTLMMASLGYVLLKRKQTAKLVYYLWVLRDRPVPEDQDFPKREINPGGQRNNWSIVLKK